MMKIAMNIMKATTIKRKTKIKINKTKRLTYVLIGDKM